MSETQPIDIAALAARITEETQRAVRRAVNGGGYFTSPAPAMASERNQRRDMRPFGVGDVARVSKMSAILPSTIF